MTYEELKNKLSDTIDQLSYNSECIGTIRSDIEDKASDIETAIDTILEYAKDAQSYSDDIEGLTGDLDDERDNIESNITEMRELLDNEIEARDETIERLKAENRDLAEENARLMQVIRSAVEILAPQPKITITSNDFKEVK